MRLNNVSATYPRLMSNVLIGLIGESCVAYVDDVIVFSNSNVNEHLRRLENELNE